MIQPSSMLTKLSKLPIEALSIENRFTIHRDCELTAANFMLGFFIMVSKGSNTLKEWSIEVSKQSKRLFSNSAINAKLQYRHIALFKSFLAYILSKQVQQLDINPSLEQKHLAPFSRVLLEDSMCFSLPKNLATIFPGSHSSKGPVATGRIQYRMDLKSGQTTHLELQSFRDNDQKFAPHILHTLKKGDLVIRDLGYWVLSVFRLIQFMEAFFLSRYRYGNNVYDAETEQRIHLAKELKKAKKKGQTIVEKQVLVGRVDKVPMRLVAIRVPQQVEQQRRRKVLKDRNKRLNHSEDYMDLLAWTIFVTNVSEQVWTPQQILHVYGYRWRIEIIFKAWKSQLNFEKLFNSKKHLTPPRAIISIYLLLCWITLFFVKFYIFFFQQVVLLKDRFVSILKFANFFKDHFEQLLGCPDWDFYIDLVAKHCTYDKRKIPNFCQQLYLLNQSFT